MKDDNSLKELIEQSKSKIGLHAAWLLANGWVANGRIYTKGNDVIKYDGTNWYLNNEQL